MKRALSALLCLCLVCGLSAAAEYADMDIYALGEYQYVVLPDGSAEIVRYTGRAGSVEIPSQLNGHPVASIGDSAFDQGKPAEPAAEPAPRSEQPAAQGSGTVRIPGTLSGLGLGSFFSREPGSMDPEEMAEMMQETFRASSGTPLTHITIPEGVTYIGARAFYGCPVATLIIPQGVSAIAEAAFAWSGLKEITLPASVTSMGRDVFEGCEGLTVYVFPDSFAERYCQRNGIPYAYAGEGD